VFAAGTMTSLASHVPLRDAVIADIEIYGMAAVTKRAGWPLHIVGWIKRSPPVAIIRNEVSPLDMIRDVPLRWLWIIVVTDFAEVTLLPDGSVNEPDITEISA